MPYAVGVPYAVGSIFDKRCLPLRQVPCSVFEISRGLRVAYAVAMEPTECNLFIEYTSAPVQTIAWVLKWDARQLRVQCHLGSHITESFSPRNAGCKIYGVTLEAGGWAYWSDRSNWPEIERLLGMRMVAVYRMTDNQLSCGNCTLLRESCCDLFKFIVMLLLFGWNLGLYFFLRQCCWDDARHTTRRITDSSGLVIHHVTPAPFFGLEPNAEAVPLCDGQPQPTCRGRRGVFGVALIESFQLISVTSLCSG